MNQFRVYTEDCRRVQARAERKLYGIYSSNEEAEQACRTLIDTFLLRSYSDNISAKNLFQQYTLFGNDAFVVAPLSSASFSARQYARVRCNQLCGTGVALAQELPLAV